MVDSVEGVSAPTGKRRKKIKDCGSPETAKKLESIESCEGVEGKDILHIGDNFISDVLMARKCGMKGFLYNRRSQS